MTFRRISESEAELHQPPTPTFHLEELDSFQADRPHYIDLTFRCKPHQHVFKYGYIGLFWATYIDAPENKSIYFRDDKGWVQYCTQTHYDESTVRYVADKLELTFTPGTRPMLYKDSVAAALQRSALLRPLRFAPIHPDVRSDRRDTLLAFASGGGPPSATKRLGTGNSSFPSMPWPRIQLPGAGAFIVSAARVMELSRNLKIGRASIAIRIAISWIPTLHGCTNRR
jgi:hypothetical protein